MIEKKPVIHRFNLFDTRNKKYNELHVKIQLILYYAESRFLSIMKTFRVADVSQVTWGQKLLQRELVWFSM